MSKINNPPPLPPSSLATKDQRIRAGLIDHFIDSTLWFWFFILVGWNILHLDASLDVRSFLIVLSSNFPMSISVIGLLLVLDLWFCVRHGQSIGQWITGIYKTGQQATPFSQINPPADIPKIWLHGLISRCLGMPLFCVCILVWLILNPLIMPFSLREFSLIEPEASFLLIVFLLKIIGSILLLFVFFLPCGVGFIRSPLPTWYDRLLGIQTHASHF